MAEFSKILGTGGIGSGVMYRLEGDATLGRNESRQAHCLPDRDFCKLHIVLHYVARFSKAWKLPVRVLPIGAVGNDSPGTIVKALMRQEGMNLRYVTSLDRAQAPTLFSVCFQYPDGSGGNLTESRSASSKVRPASIKAAQKEFKGRGKCMTLAVPEVPLDARFQLLSMGRRRGAFNVASFVAEEMKEVRARDALKNVDLISLNLEEAAAFAERRASTEPQRLLRACVQKSQSKQPGLCWAITNGGRGSLAWNGRALEYLPAIKVAATNTAGAGDAFLAGLMLGLLRGRPLMGTSGATCTRLARLISAFSVTGRESIHFGATVQSLRAFARKTRQRGLEAFLGQRGGRGKSGRG